MHPGVGVGVFIRKENKVLMSIRKDNGYLALPGGHVEMYEEFEECAIREVKEETNLDILDPKILQIENVVKKEINHHFIVIFLVADYFEKSPLMNMEPHKHHDWHWVDAQEFKKNYDEEKLFYGLMKLVKRHGNAQQLFDKILSLPQ